MKINLRNKTAVVSGSSSGIGFAIAKGLAEAGAAVVLSGRTEQHLTAAVERLQTEIPEVNVTGLIADLSTAAGVRRFTEQVPNADILVNNLGVFEPKPFFDISDEDWEHYFAVNVMSAVRLSRHYARGMVAQKWGRVLFNASITSGFFDGEMVHYGATKAAMLGLSRGMAESVANTGVTVNAFIPGPTLTEKSSAFMNEMSQSSGKTFKQMESELFAETLSTSLIKRFLQPVEVANLVTFLASDQAAAITGAAIRVDGGIVRSLL